MIFTELRFLLFFGVVFVVHWALRGRTARKVWLLAASWAFYCAWDWRFLGLILASTAIDLLAGRGIAATTDAAVRRRWLGASLVVNLGLLGFFKYWGWFLDSGLELLRWLGIPASGPTLAIVLPVGISFYTFQTLSYTIDVYRGRIPPARSALDLATFVAFFPQLVAGPIVRAGLFLPQLEQDVRLARVDVRGCLVLFLIGYFKKAVVSDTVAGWVVDPYFAQPELYDAFGAVVALLFQLVVLYCDFSGYSDMAIACAGLLGYNLCVNFDFPWFASSPIEFWRRWHISLSEWMRDYVYHPLGGAHGSWRKYARNVMITMVLIGVWHGAAWKFAVFGGVHGLAILGQTAWTRSALGRALPRGTPLAVAGTLVTVAFHALTMPFFRAFDVAAAGGIVRDVLTWSGRGARTFPAAWLAVLAALTLVHGLTRWNPLPGWWRRVPPWAFAPAFGAAFAVVLACSAPLAEPFVYFQF